MKAALAVDEIVRLGDSRLRADRAAYEKAAGRLWDRVDEDTKLYGGWNPAGGEADDVDLHDMVDGVHELPRVKGVGRVAVVTGKRDRTLYIGRRTNGSYWRWFTVLYEAPAAPRANPGAKRRTPAILRHCVAKVAPKRGTSGAFAICTASLQRAGVLRGARLTARGKRRDGAHRAHTKGNRAKDAAFERTLRAPQKDLRAESDALRVARGIRSDATAKITRSTPDYPILEIDYARNLSKRDLVRLERSVGKLGWRAWGIGFAGIAFKPTSVDIE